MSHQDYLYKARTESQLVRYNNHLHLFNC